MTNKESGSLGMAAIGSLLALSLAAFYVKNTSDQSNNAIKKSKIENQAGDAWLNNMSNLAILRGMVNASKGPPASEYQPAIYVADYFSPQWNYLKNPNRAGKIDVSGPKVAVKSFKTERDVTSVEKIFAGKGSSGQIAELANIKNLEIVRTNIHEGKKYLVTSIDVRSKNPIAASASATNVQRNLDTMARIPLMPPEPGPVTLEIKPEVGGTWGKEFGKPNDPLPPGRYLMRMTSSGVVYYGKIKFDDGREFTLGLDDKGNITHQARNILASKVEIGITEPVELGMTEKQAVEEIKAPPPDAVIPAPAGDGSAPRIINVGCQVQIGSGTPIWDGGTAPAPTAPVATTMTPSAPKTTYVPAVIEVTMAAAYGVDELPGPNPGTDFPSKIYVTKTVITPTVTQTPVASAPGTATPGPGYDGNNCRSRCPMSTDESLQPDYFWTMFRNASAGSADKRLVDFYEPGRTLGGLQQGLGVKGVVCANLELVADKLEADTGLANIADLKNPANNDKWPIFDAGWSSGAAKPLERFYAYTAPSCSRQFVGMRGACGCFEESTLIRMADGSERPVSSIRQGDLVWNPKTSSAAVVARVIAGPEKPSLYAVKVGGNTLKVTSGHPFLSPFGLIAAKDLRPGDTIIHDQTELRVDDIIVEARAAGSVDPTVWNFELEGAGDDSHYVLANGIMTGDLYLQLKLQNEKP